MRCPSCSSMNTVVKDSRTIEGRSIVRRRRYCQACSKKFVTEEQYRLKQLFVVKKTGQRKNFESKKIIDSIAIAVRKRNITPQQVRDIAEEIIKDLQASSLSEISTKKLGDSILGALAKIDEVAYIRFASVYIGFDSADDFTRFIADNKNSTK